MAKLSTMALIGLVMVAFLAMATFATHNIELSHTAPKLDDSNASMNQFVAYKTETDPWTTWWLNMQVDVQVTGSLQSWFLYFYEPSYIYKFNINAMNFVSNRGYFYDPSNPSAVYIYEIRPSTTQVNGSAKYFSNFKYFYCGTQSMESYKASNLTHARETHLEADCTEVSSIIWSKGYFLTFWTWYSSRNTSDYTQNLPVYKQYANHQFMYAGINNIGVLHYANAYGRTHMVQANSVVATPDYSNGYATANVTYYMYNMNSPKYGYVLPYDNVYFSVKSVGMVPICSFWNMRTKYGFTPTMIPYSNYNTYYTSIPSEYDLDGWIVTCTISAATQAQDATGRSYAWAQFRVHDIKNEFGFLWPEFSSEYKGAPADPWQNFVQNTVELSWF